MSQISEFSSTEDGEAAANTLLELMRVLNAPLPQLPPASQENSAKVIALVRSHTFRNRPYPAVEGFLQTLLRDEESDGGIITVLGARTLQEDQANMAPMCNLPDSAPFIQFAYWSGAISDGDAWVFDLQDSTVRCIPVASGDGELDQVRARSYGVFTTLDHFVGFLRVDAEIRGWI